MIRRRSARRQKKPNERVYVHPVTHGAYFTNNSLVHDGDSPDALLVDATGDPEGLIDEANHWGLQIVAVVATHSHHDHIGGVAGIKERLDVPFMTGEHALESLRQERARALEREGFTIPEAPQPDRLLADGDLIEVGTVRFEVLYTPGHWKGDISLYEPKGKVVFTGDSLLKNGIGRANEGCDVEELLGSIKSRLLVLPDETRVYAGHGEETTIGEARQNNKDLQELLP